MWAKVLILVGFYDIGGDIGILMNELVKCLILLDFWWFWIVVFIFLSLFIL